MKLRQRSKKCPLTFEGNPILFLILIKASGYYSFRGTKNLKF